MFINETYLSLGRYKDVGYDSGWGKDVMVDDQGREFRVPSSSFHPAWRTETLLVREFVTNDNIELVLLPLGDGTFYEERVTVMRTANVRSISHGNAPWDLLSLYQEDGVWYVTPGSEEDRREVKPLFLTGDKAREARRLIAWRTVAINAERGVIFDDTLGTTIWCRMDGAFEIKMEGAGPAAVYSDPMALMRMFTVKLEQLFGWKGRGDHA